MQAGQLGRQRINLRYDFLDHVFSDAEATLHVRRGAIGGGKATEAGEEVVFYRRWCLFTNGSPARAAFQHPLQVIDLALKGKEVFVQFSWGNGCAGVSIIRWC